MSHRQQDKNRTKQQTAKTQKDKRLGKQRQGGKDTLTYIYRERRINPPFGRSLGNRVFLLLLFEYVYRGKVEKLR